MPQRQLAAALDINYNEFIKIYTLHGFTVSKTQNIPQICGMISDIYLTDFYNALNM
jgi:hypothetical protein